jgi:hypothetical protein
MSKLNYSGIPRYYIDYIDPKTGKLSDISLECFSSLEGCQAQIDSEKKQDLEIEQQLLDKYEEDLKNFVLDIDTTDHEPLNPVKLLIKYNKCPHLYIVDEKGYHEVTEHCIKYLFTLNASAEQIETVNYIFNGVIDPETIHGVDAWLTQCFNKPNPDEIKMQAINQVLEGYGIESVRTSKWKNGFWCDVLCTYVNMGDSYIPTVIHHRKHGFMVSSIGDVIEKNKHVI